MHAAYQARQRGEDPMRVLEESGEGSGEDEPGEGNGRASRRSGKLSSKIMRCVRSVAALAQPRGLGMTPRSPPHSMDDNTIEKERHKLRAIMKRQDRLLHVCLRVLLNLAEVRGGKRLAALPRTRVVTLPPCGSGPLRLRRTSGWRSAL